ncbi:hypothetical protein CDAR_502071 [Caerostris darwini]|uniref:Uncharacterized protein n=1 Tax=Caerostris darwini TaxID=1538125 RepID=A0AAV4VVW8_9ARAC|nr:hypothetical protein CDAR_502071 [Caerostris darwini]
MLMLSPIHNERGNSFFSGSTELSSVSWGHKYFTSAPASKSPIKRSSSNDAPFKKETRLDERVAKNGIVGYLNPRK